MWGHWDRCAKLSPCWSIAQRGRLEEDKRGGVHLTPRRGSIWAAPRALGWGCERTRAGSAVGPGWAPSRWSRGSIVGRQLAARLLLGKAKRAGAPEPPGNGNRSVGASPVASPWASLCLLSLGGGRALAAAEQWHCLWVPFPGCLHRVLSLCHGRRGRSRGCRAGLPPAGLGVGRDWLSHHVGVVWVLLAPRVPLRPHLRAPLLWFSSWGGSGTLASPAPGGVAAAPGGGWCWQEQGQGPSRGPSCCPFSSGQRL